MEYRKKGMLYNSENDFAMSTMISKLADVKRFPYDSHSI